MNAQNARYARLRYTATGAVAALAAAGAIATSGVLAATPANKTRSHAAVASGPAIKAPGSKAPDKTRSRQPAVNQWPFFSAIQQLVDDGTISTTQAQSVDSEIRAGGIDSDLLASGGFTPTQLQAVQQALANAKRGLATAVTGAPKEPPPAGTVAPSGGKQPPPVAAGNNSTAK